MCLGSHIHSYCKHMANARESLTHDLSLNLEHPLRLTVKCFPFVPHFCPNGIPQPLYREHPNKVKTLP